MHSRYRIRAKVLVALSWALLNLALVSRWEARTDAHVNKNIRAAQREDGSIDTDKLVALLDAPGSRAPRTVAGFPIVTIAVASSGGAVPTWARFGQAGLWGVVAYFVAGAFLPRQNASMTT